MNGEKILIVDDSEVNLLLLKEVLGGIGYEVSEASNAKKALDIIGTTPVDMVVLDMYMPEMDGISFLKTYRSRGNNSPVIALSASNDEKLYKDAFDLGVNEFLKKPVDFDVLISKIEKHLIAS